MELSMAGFAAYELVNVATGIALYQTFATETEIIKANRNLRDRGNENRYYPAGTYVPVSIHG